MPRKFEYTERDLEEGIKYLMENLGKNEQEEIPYFEGWTPAYKLEDQGFKREYKIDLLDLGKKTSWDNVVKKIKDKKTSVEVQVSYDDAKDEIFEVSTKDREQGRKFAGSKKVFEENKEKIEKAFLDLKQRSLDFVVFRTYRGWPAIWDSVEFFSKAKK